MRLRLRLDFGLGLIFVLIGLRCIILIRLFVSGLLFTLQDIPSRVNSGHKNIIYTLSRDTSHVST